MDAGLVTVYTFQMAAMTLALVLLISAAVRLYFIGMKLPTSEFRTAFMMMATGFLMLGGIVVGFMVPKLQMLDGSDSWGTFNMLMGFVGVTGAIFLIYSTQYVMKFLQGDKA